MINALAVILGFQLAGEVIARLLALAVPGPVIGALLLVAALFAWPSVLPRQLSNVAHTLLAHLSLLFVPAAVGVMEHRALLSDHGVALVAALFVSTLLALIVGALVFRLVARD